MPRFKSIIFYQNIPKMKLFLQKNAKFSSAGGFAPKPPASGGRFSIFNFNFQFFIGSISIEVTGPFGLPWLRL